MMQGIGQSNLFSDVPAKLATESIKVLLARPGARIERIISTGQSSPQGFWYDQAGDEWVLLVQGAARLRFEDGRMLDLYPGDHLHIPAHQRHRVEWTTPDQPTIWLAVHLQSIS